MGKLWSYNEQGECVIRDVRKLPQPVVHMLANSPRYFSICDNYLRGYSGFDYTRMFGEFDGPNFPKNNARFLWLRLADGEPWLVNDFGPCAAGTDGVSFRMGMGYADFRNVSKKMGLTVDARVFVPLDDMLELWMVEITNNGTRATTVDFIPAVPIFGGNRAYTEYHRDVVRLYNKSRVNDHIEILPGLEWVEGKTGPSDICYYMSAESEQGTKGSRFYSDRETFLGAAGSWFAPEAVVNNRPPKCQCLGKEAVGAIEFKKVAVPAKGTARFVVINGIAHGSGDAEKQIRRYNYAAAAAAFEKLREFWRERTSRVTIWTGNRDLTTCWNTWWCYQLSMRYWFGNTGHPQFDYGSDFAGWRDFWQDMMAATVIDPQGLEKRTLHTLEGIRLDGTNATRFFARTKEFGSDEVNGLWCDHPYWTTQTVLLLVNFLGDLSFLFRGGIAYFRDSYRDRGDTKDTSWQAGTIGLAKTGDGDVYRGTVVEHLLVQLLTMFYDVGSSNLLKQKRADWNDAVDQVKGENVTFSMGLAQDCEELAGVLEAAKRRLGVTDIEVFEELAGLIENWPQGTPKNLPVDAKKEKMARFLRAVNGNISGRKKKIAMDAVIADLKAKAAATIDTVNKAAWNGEYYVGYFHADGKPVDGIFRPGATRRRDPTTEDFVMMLMPQTWALLSGAADKIGVTETVLKSVNRLLKDAVVGGLKLNYPAYRAFDKKVGRITGFAAGTKENNAIFCHANLFMVWALLRRRRAEEAFGIFSGINPLEHDQATLRTGPWIPEYYISSDNPDRAGRGEYPMLTASGGWTRYLFQNFFFGVKGELDGLRVNPCLPARPEFRECGLSVHFRGAQYEIVFRNPKLKRNATVASIAVDGRKIDGTLITPFKEGNHVVEVILDGAT